MSVSQLNLPPGHELSFHEAIDSTNAEALRRAAANAPQGLWVWAERQSAGKGRAGRFWESLPGNLFASVLLRPACTPLTTTQLGFVAGVAVHDAVSAFCNVRQSPDLALKWPNDLLIGGKKAGGILLQGASGPTRQRAVVVGIGINVVSCPLTADFAATSLVKEGIDADVPHLLERLAWGFEKWCAIWSEGAGFSDIRDAWLERTLPLGAPVRVKLGNDPINGVFDGIDETGTLIIGLRDGGQKRITTGDVFPL